MEKRQRVDRKLHRGFVRSRLARPAALGSLLAFVAAASAQTSTNLMLSASSLSGTKVVPPPMSRRVIAPSTNPPAGDTVLLEDATIKFTLFIPDGWSAPVSGKTIVGAHFHTTIWFIIQEHLRRRAREPLVCFQLGEGSTIYRQAFEDTGRFRRVLRLVEAEFKRRGLAAEAHITGIDVSSFSAGYGAVRELIKSPEYFSLIRRIVLLDSMYAAYDETAVSQSARKPVSEQISVWAPFARAALSGQKTFVLTHSAVPTRQYASSAECATALLEVLGVPREPVAPDAFPASIDPDFPLQSRSDAGGFHIWGYGGQDAQAHMTHVRHLADVWRAIDGQ